MRYWANQSVPPGIGVAILGGFGVAGILIGVAAVGIGWGLRRWHALQQTKGVLERSRI